MTNKLTSQEYRFIKPVDVLYLRGNKLFGDPGSFSESLVPPWPSVAAGAIRSRMLVDDKVNLNAFAKGKIDHPELGNVESPGSFVLTGFYLAKNQANQLEILMPLPADLVINETAEQELILDRLVPTKIHNGLLTSYPLSLMPVLAQAKTRSKAVTGYWLNQAGWETYLAGNTPSNQHLVASSELWALDARVGIGMNPATGSVEEGKLFSAQAVAFKEGVGFVATVKGAIPPKEGLLRFGGDGRAASIKVANLQITEPKYSIISKAKRCALILTSPALFPDGWLLPGLDKEQNFKAKGISARLVAAAITRPEIISGWDLAKQQPKPAQKVVPAGSVYWLDELNATPEALQEFVEQGLSTSLNTARKAEGFNQFTLAVWT